MRTLKKTLSLVLVLAMVMSLGVSAFAADAKTDYADYDTVTDTHKEAVDVMTAVGVFNGIDGNFKPGDTLTRAMAAKIVTYMLLGQTQADKLVTTVAPYSDVPVTHWAAGAIAYCSNEGILAGTGDGTFQPEVELTGMAFAKMLLCALGYDFAQEKLVGDSWAINTAKLFYANATGLSTNMGTVSATESITREQAAQMALNAVKAPLVEYNGTTVTVGDTSVVVGGNGSSYVTTTIAKEQTISRQRLSNTGSSNGTAPVYTVEFGEKYIKDLVVVEDIDAFGRPSYTWTYKNDDIDTYVNYDLMVAEYTTAVKGSKVYSDIGSVNAGYDLTNYVDGVAPGAIVSEDLARNNNNDLANTGNGVLTQVFADDETKELTITVINTYLAKATGDYSASKEYAPLNVYVGYNKTVANYNVDVEDVPAVAGVANDEYYLVNISYMNTTRGEVKILKDVSIQSDSEVTKYSQNGTKVTKLTTDGTEYSTSECAFYDFPDVLTIYNNQLLTDRTYNVYFDEYGYVIGLDEYSGTARYVFITGFNRPTSNIAISTADAAAIFLDGTMEVIKVNVGKTNKNIDRDGDGTSDYIGYTLWTDGAYNGDNGNPLENRWYSYTVTESGVYTLSPVAMTVREYTGATRTTIKTNNLSVVGNVAGDPGNGTRVYGEDDSVYITVKQDDVDTEAVTPITEVNGVYTGVQDVSLDVALKTETGGIPSVYTVYDRNYYIIGAIVIGEVEGKATDIAYNLSTTAKWEQLEGGYYYWGFDAIVNGEIKELTVKSEYSTAIQDLLNHATDNHRYEKLRFDADGYVVGFDHVTKIYADANLAGAIDGQDVYDITGMNGTVNGVDELTLQGRTLYITNNQSDAGLALTSSAKAVVIQDENGETNVKTEFNTVSAAIAHLADDGKPYDGAIFAVLNSDGAAEWIVFVSARPLTTGSSGPATPTTNVLKVDEQYATLYYNMGIRWTVSGNKITFTWSASELNANLRSGVFADAFVTGDDGIMATVGPDDDNYLFVGVHFPTANTSATVNGSGTTLTACSDSGVHEYFNITGAATGDNKDVFSSRLPGTTSNTVIAGNTTYTIVLDVTA